MDFNHRTLYCNECGDYVYDNELTDVIVRQETIQSESRKYHSYTYYSSSLLGLNNH